MATAALTDAALFVELESATVRTGLLRKRIADLWPYILLAIALLGLAYRLWIGRF